MIPKFSSHFLFFKIAIFFFYFQNVTSLMARDQKFCNDVPGVEAGFNFANQSCYYYSESKNLLNTTSTSATNGSISTNCTWLKTFTLPIIHSEKENEFVAGIGKEYPLHSICLGMRVSGNGPFRPTDKWDDGSNVIYWPTNTDEISKIGKQRLLLRVDNKTWYWDKDCEEDGERVFKLIKNLNCQYGYNENMVTECYDPKLREMVQRHPITKIVDRINIPPHCVGEPCPLDPSENCSKSPTELTTGYENPDSISEPIIITTRIDEINESSKSIDNPIANRTEKSNPKCGPSKGYHSVALEDFAAICYCFIFMYVSSLLMAMGGFVYYCIDMKKNQKKYSGLSI